MIIKAFTPEFFREIKEIRKRRILFFNGVFDIVHLGHLKMINDILKERNNYYIVCGLNSDESVKLQNKSHPLVNDEDARAEFIKSLGINCVIKFDEKTPLALLMYLMPDAVSKGDEYKDKDYEEKSFLNSICCHIKYYNHIAGYSTTNIYNKIEENVKADLRRKLDA